MKSPENVIKSQQKKAQNFTRSLDRFEKMLYI